MRSILMPTKPPPWGRKTTHTPKANRNPMPQRVIHPTNKTPASSSLANFKVQQASRIKRSISTTLVIIRRATTGTTFRKGSWQRNKPQYHARVRTYGNPPAYGHTPQSGNWNQLSCSSVPGSGNGNKQITPDVVPKVGVFQCPWILQWKQTSSP